LKLPPWLEERRPVLERDLPPVSIPYKEADILTKQEE